MFFYLSKILAFLLSPLTWVIILFLYSFITKNKKRALPARIVVAFLLLFFSNPFIADECFRQWETESVNVSDISEPFEAGIVLGGGINYDAKNDRVNFGRSGDRLLQAIELYRMGKIKSIIVTGGSGDLHHPELSEADMMERYFEYARIPGKDVILENQSKNTYENALFTARILKSNYAGKRLLLITNAYHLKRAEACFDKQGIKTSPFGVDRMSGPRKFNIDHLLIPSSEIFFTWDLFLHEMFGYVIYKAMGYI